MSIRGIPLLDSCTINEFTPRKATTKRALLAVALALSLAVPASAQTKEEIKTEAESQLQKMTPAEIDQKLSELGLTREEAIAKAHEYGISLEDYLSRLKAPGSEENVESPFGREENPLFVDPRLVKSKSSVRFLGDLDSAAARRLRPLKKVPVPGFHDRYGVDSLLQPFGFEMFQFPSTFFTPSAMAAP
ncbi:MAG TPA: hypothetical protein VL126_12450, partial [Bacteroidota bacterium]|nr:hypothetical protein [Bacteroidota bacterium]